MLDRHVSHLGLNEETMVNAKLTPYEGGANT